MLHVKLELMNYFKRPIKSLSAQLSIKNPLGLGSPGGGAI